MGKLIISTAMTVDAVIEVGEWFVPGGGHTDAALERFGQAEAMLVGRTTFEGLAGYWAPLDDEWARLINPMPKYVASRTRHGQLEWNGTVIEGDVAEGVAKLKEELGGDLILIGCGELARHLAGQGLIDEFHFGVHPAVQGPGARPFQGDASLRLRLLDATAYDSGVTLLRYEQADRG
jgi:dihydrofolate reductase